MQRTEERAMGQVRVIDDSGASHLVTLWQTFVLTDTLRDGTVESPGSKTLKLSNGRAVDFDPDTQVFTVVSTGQKLRFPPE